MITIEKREISRLQGITDFIGDLSRTLSKHVNGIERLAYEVYADEANDAIVEFLVAEYTTTPHRTAINCSGNGAELVLEEIHKKDILSKPYLGQAEYYEHVSTHYRRLVFKDGFVDYNFLVEQRLSQYDFWNIAKQEIDEGVVICGNPNLCPDGDKHLIGIVEQYGCPEEVEEAARALTEESGETYLYTRTNGCVQSEWQYVFYKEGTSSEYISLLSEFYWGNFTVLVDDDGLDYYVPDSVMERGAKGICEYLGIDGEEYTVLRIQNNYSNHIHYEKI